MNLKILRIYIDSNNWTREKWNLSLLNTKTRIYYTGSWFHSKDVSALLEYKNVILKLFEPKGTYKKNVDTIFGDLRLRYDVIIGIHIRRGDYVNFRGGSYLFDDSIYNKYMEVLRNECAIVRKNVCFFLSSDENICYPHFNEYELSYLEKPIMIEDLYALSKCDYILGPPSTFSMWASFIGDVPLRIVKYSNETITLNQFSPILYQNVFKNQLHFCHVDRNIDTDLHDKSFNVRPA